MATKSPPQKLTLSAFFRKYFFTGLLVLAPVWITVYIIQFIVRTLGGALSPYVRRAALSSFGSGHSTGLINFVSDIIAFLLTVLLITFIGYAVRKVIGQRLIEGFRALVTRIPVAREIYNGVSKFLDVLFGDKSKFRRVVAVRFPTDRVWSIGFVTSEMEMNIPHDSTATHISVFVPKTPNPTAGYLLLCLPQDVIPLELSVDEAIKLIVSGGTLVPEKFMPALK